MTCQLIATYPNQTRISRDFDSAADAIQYGREVWASMNKAHVALLAVREGKDINVIWRRPVTHLTEDQRPAEGYYGVDGHRYHVSCGKEGSKWEGWMFFATGSDYHDRYTFTCVRPDGSVTKTHSVLDAIVADPFARRCEYGQITGKCSVCGRKLEDPVSRSIGMGPVCRSRF